MLATDGRPGRTNAAGRRQYGALNAPGDAMDAACGVNGDEVLGRNSGPVCLEHLLVAWSTCRSLDAVEFDASRILAAAKSSMSAGRSDPDRSARKRAAIRNKLEKAADACLRSRNAQAWC